MPYSYLGAFVTPCVLPLVMLLHASFIIVSHADLNPPTPPSSMTYLYGRPLSTWSPHFYDKRIQMRLTPFIPWGHIWSPWSP